MRAVAVALAVVVALLCYGHDAWGAALFAWALGVLMAPTGGN